MQLRQMAWAARALLSGQLARELVLAAASQYRVRPTECPCCGYSGIFRGTGTPVRFGAQCPKCKSQERQRLLARAVAAGFMSFQDREVLHFAPERALTELLEHYKPKRLVTSSYPDHLADLRLNIEAIELPEASFDAIICSHVLEHVDDRKALGELHRILRPGGELIIEVPIVEGWAETYEDPAITSQDDRHLHFGQFDHIRYYGRDLRNRIRDAGFDLREFTATPQEVLRYGLQRGETVFLAVKPGSANLKKC